LGRGLKGKNDSEYSLTYREQWIILSLLKQLLGKDVNFDHASEGECKEWSAALRNNIGKMRLLTIQGRRFGMLEGTDIQELFSRGFYADGGGSRIKPSEIKGAPIEPLNEYWRDSVLEFAEFLESCGGLAPLEPYP